MAVKKKKTGGAKRTGTRKPAAAATGNGAAASAAAKAEEKRAAREAQESAQQAAIVKRVVNGDEAVSAVAKDLKITAGKAAFLIMKHRVATGDVAAISGKNDETLLKNINTARTKADEFSSWGWLAARSGRSEGFIKAGLEKAGLYKPGKENIASKRAASKPKTAPAATSGKGKGKRTGKAKVRGNA